MAVFRARENAGGAQRVRRGDRGDQGTREALRALVHDAPFQLAALDPLLEGLPHGVGGFCDALAQAQGMGRPMEHPTFYRMIQIDGLSIFYREADPKEAPTLLLLHGLPSSSRMFEPLFARLSDCYHLVARDYPGFGHSDRPDPKKFAYTFDHFGEIMNRTTEARALMLDALYAGLRRPVDIWRI